MAQPGVPTGINWAGYAETWISVNGWKPSTKRFYRMVLRDFCGQFPQMPTVEETQEWVEGLKRIKGAGRRGPLPRMSDSTKTKYYKIIREFYFWLKYEYTYGASDPRFIPRWRENIPNMPYKSFGLNKYRFWRNIAK